MSSTAHEKSGAPVSSELPAKQELLSARLHGIGSLIVAYSGGADSAFLAWAAQQALGERALAVTALSPSFSTHDREQAEAFARQHHLNHMQIETREFQNPLYIRNEPDRCYHCKAELFGALESLRAARGFAAVAYGVNADDLQDFRPGHRAAREFGIAAPLLDAGLTKADVRELSRRAGLATWDRPASACLSSRVPYGMPVTIETLSRVDRAEAELRALGFRQVRVRSYGDFASVEIAREELARALEPKCAMAIEAHIQAAGFARVQIDPRGYRQGALNEALGRGGMSRDS